MHDNAVEQLILFDELGEAQLYHDIEAFGFFSILYQVGARKHQRSYILPMMPDVLRALPKNRDTWLSQAEFTRPNRRCVNLARLPLLFCDLDCYTKSPESALSSLLWLCDEAAFPHPSVVIFSGRGLQPKWLLDRPLPRWALPRWNAVQSKLVDMLESIDADPRAKDASRVLRLNATTNTKSGEMVRVIHITTNPQGNPIQYGFEYLAEFLLPNSRDVYDKKKQNHPYTDNEKEAIVLARKARQSDYDALKKRKQLKLIDGGKTSGLNRFSGRQLAWHRLEDIRKLVEIRGGISPGQGMSTLFWSINFLLLSGATNSSQMWQEAIELCQQYGFGEFHRRDELSTLYSKAKAYEAGKMVTFGGQEYPPLYTPKNQSLIDIFAITSDEQMQLRTIISKDMKKERDAVRKRSMRHAKGENMMTREAYL